MTYIANKNDHCFTDAGDVGFTVDPKKTTPYLPTVVVISAVPLSKFLKKHLYTPWSVGPKLGITSSPSTSSSVFKVVLIEIGTPSLLHSKLGTGDPRAAQYRVILSSTFVTLTTEGGALVIAGGTVDQKKNKRGKLPKCGKKLISIGALSEI